MNSEKDRQKKPEPPERVTWTQKCIGASEFVRGLRRMDKDAHIDPTKTQNIDWLAVAIGNLGGPADASLKLGVSATTVYNWLGNGIRRLPFERVIQIAEAGDVPIEFLKRRAEKETASKKA